MKYLLKLDFFYPCKGRVCRDMRIYTITKEIRKALCIRGTISGENLLNTKILLNFGSNNFLTILRI